MSESLLLYSLVALLLLGHAGAVSALICRRRLRLPDDSGRQSRAATIVAAASTCAVVALGGLGAFLQFLAVGLRYAEDPDLMPASTPYYILAGAGVPVLLVAAALVFTRATRRFRSLYLLGLYTPVLPFILWFLGFFVPYYVWASRDLL